MHLQTSDKRNINGYCTVHLLPICGKFLKDLFLTQCLAFFLLINLFYLTCPASNVEIHVSISHGIYKSFHDGLEV